MSDFPFSIPRRGDADVVNGVSYAGDTLTLTRAEGSDLTTTIATGDPTKIEDGNSSMEITSAGGDCVFTPNGDAALTTTFAADGGVTVKDTFYCGTPITDANQTAAFKGSFGNVNGVYELNANAGNNGAVLAVGNSTYDDNAVIASFGRGSGNGTTTWEIGAAEFRHKRGVGDVLVMKTSSNNVIFGNISSAQFITFKNGGGIDSTVALNEGSDDRLKENEKLIVNATEILQKLTPQTYHKYTDLDLSGVPVFQSGLIAQEVYYNAPELRHLVGLGNDYLRDASGNAVEEEITRTYFTPTPEEMDLSDVDIANDPDYANHGWSKTQHSSLNYTGFIPYLIKSNQELAERLAALENK